MINEDRKKAAAEEAAKRVRNGQRLGLGTGSTAKHFLDALSKRLRGGELFEIVGVPTSRDTEQIARFLGIPLTTLESEHALDLTVDGADEVDPNLCLIKGLGGALLKEKIVAAASKRFIVIVDSGKLVKQLGQRVPVPVEVLPFGWKATAEKIEGLGGRPVLRKENDLAYMTDQDNHILDCHFGPISDAEALARKLDLIPGVLAHGLFLGMADEVIVGAPEGTRVLTR